MVHWMTTFQFSQDQKLWIVGGDQCIIVDQVDKCKYKFDVIKEDQFLIISCIVNQFDVYQHSICADDQLDLNTLYNVIDEAINVSESYRVKCREGVLYLKIMSTYTREYQLKRIPVNELERLKRKVDALTEC